MVREDALRRRRDIIFLAAVRLERVQLSQAVDHDPIPPGQILRVLSSDQDALYIEVKPINDRITKGTRTGVTVLDGTECFP